MVICNRSGEGGWGLGGYMVHPQKPPYNILIFAFLLCINLFLLFIINNAKFPLVSVSYILNIVVMLSCIYSSHPNKAEMLILYSCLKSTHWFMFVCVSHNYTIGTFYFQKNAIALVPLKLINNICLYDVQRRMITKHLMMMGHWVNMEAKRRRPRRRRRWGMKRCKEKKSMITPGARRSLTQMRYAESLHTTVCVA